MKAKIKTALAGAGVVLAAAVGPTLFVAPPATAAMSTITVTFADWRCNAIGGGKVVAVQMGSQYGSVPKAAGNTIRINAKVNASNNLTGAVWCKSWWRPVAVPVYNIHQGLWVERADQHFNV
ncbi:hypothetical protein [Prescottella agglutinans]|uniref:Uncharacterized protein n=1 Tax=Prescottella agglutinans TaxID=1644129 RepID=A0ABT6MKT2_9NOCA|nr:hypothetical protein [Prescottella agglutinans]MDH6284910.1 hypothetical protein [Prescottella agglutinans]